MTYYCPFCWRELTETVDVCPRCGAGLASFSDLPYEEKLLMALHHPIRENRRIAIQILGELHSELAVAEFRGVLEREEDVFVVQEALTALSLIGTADAKALVQAAVNHRFSPIRRLARTLVRPK